MVGGNDDAATMYAAYDLLERYGAAAAVPPAAARALKTVNGRREFGASPGVAETK